MVPVVVPLTAKLLMSQGREGVRPSHASLLQ